MTVRANWHIAELDVGDVDALFDDDQRIEEVGVPVPLEEDLSLRLVELVESEGALFERGVRCEIKDRPDTCCHACPLYREDGELGALCQVGREQERVATQLSVERRGQRRD